MTFVDVYDASPKLHQRARDAELPNRWRLRDSRNGVRGVFQKRGAPCLHDEEEENTSQQRMLFPIVDWASSFFEISGIPVGVDALRRGRGANSLSKIYR